MDEHQFVQQCFLFTQLWQSKVADLQHTQAIIKTHTNDHNHMSVLCQLLWQLTHSSNADHFRDVMSGIL